MNIRTTRNNSARLPWLGALLLGLTASGGHAQTVRTENVLPAITDPAINGWLSAHGTAFSVETDQRGELFVYLHGQGGSGTGAGELLRTAAQEGYHAVGLTYPNDWSPFSFCNGSGDPDCAETLRREIIDGVDRSTAINVSRANSIENRLYKLLLHMEAAHPGEGWGTYVNTSTGEIRWNLVAVWGHSQGGGNAGVLARHRSLARVCLSAPAADGGPGSPAAWWATHATESGRYFGFCHSQDALNSKVAFWNALGMGAFGGVMDVAGTSPPFGGTHQLSSTVEPAVAGQYHNSVVSDAVTPRNPDNTPVYKPVWQYMMTAPRAEAPSVAPSRDDQVFAVVPTFSGQAELMMDIHGALTGEGPRPVLVWIHGGGWQGGSHNQTPSFALDLRSRGITVVSVGYRLSGQAIFPAQMHDCKGAIRWLRAHAQELQIDPARIGVWGSSAGGHLSALVSTSGNEPSLEGTTGGNLEHSSAVIAGGVNFGPTDLLQMHPDCSLQAVGCSSNHDANTSPESKLLGVDQAGQGLAWLRANLTNPDPPFPEKAALAADSNPITRLDPSDPPLYLGHGDQDVVVPLNQSLRLRDAALAAGVWVRLTVAEGFGHGSLGTDVSAAMGDWMADRLLGVPLCPSDVNESGVVDLIDLLDFVSGWSASLGLNVVPHTSGDSDGNGVVDLIDLLEFVSDWTAHLGTNCS